MWTQARLAIAAVIFVAWSAGLSYLVWQAALTTAAGRERDLMSKQLDQVLERQEEAEKQAAKRQKMLDRLVKSEGKVREIIRDNPSGCRLPDPVHDGLREAIRQGNAPRKVSGAP